MSGPIQWSFDADFLQACSCDYGCPCEFSAPPTRGFCEGVGVWKIRRGLYGTLSLDGLSLAFIARWPKAMHEGNGTVCLLIDQTANAEQRQALLQIGSGKAGGAPFEIVATTFSKILDPLFVPFRVQLNGRESGADVGDVMRFKFAPIKNPVTGEPESVQVSHSTGFIFKDADCVATDELRVSAGELNFSWPKKAGFVARVSYSN